MDLSESLQLMAAARGSIQPPNCSFLPWFPDNAKKGGGGQEKQVKIQVSELKRTKQPKHKKEKRPPLQGHECKCTPLQPHSPSPCRAGQESWTDALDSGSRPGEQEAS